MDDRCYKSDTCEKKSDNSCRLGYKKVGFEVCGYWTSKGKAICCEETIAPKTCTWRGSGGDCNGQCHTGEVRLFQSKRGGGFKTESSNYGCGRGWKAFCCEEEEYDELLSGCRWTGCGGKCSEDENSLAYSTQFPRHCSILWFGTHLCCPKSKPEPLIDCHWVVQGDCAKNSCANYEVTVGTEGYGGDKDSCACMYRVSWVKDIIANLISLKGADAKHSAVNTTRKPLSVPGIGLKLRGGLRNEAERVVDEESSAGSLRWARIITLPMNDAKASCFATKLEVVSRNDLTKKQIETSVDTDHNPDLQYATALLETAMTGILPNGTHMVTQAIDYKDIYDYWSKDVLPKLPSAGSSRVVKSPNDYFMDRWGSKGNRSPFLLLDLQDPSLFAKLLKATIQGGNGHDGILDPIKWISGAVPRLRRLHEIHQEFDYNWYLARTDNARKWVIEQLDLIENAFQKASPVPANFKTVMDTVAEFKTEARLIRPPPEDPKKYH
ncbi:unnamed protein product [Fusarium graminearum]|nr:unnamed protein product [Fusarium graminearum]